MISEEASFSKLSPSSMAAMDFGMRTKRVMACVLTASGGDTMPPSRKPNAKVKPDMSWLVTTATEVMTTGEGETIIVTSEDGASARFAGEALRASNGVAIPLDGVLHKVAAPAG